jgi:hypothetical protein
VFSGEGDAGGAVRFVQEHADLGALEQRHRVLGMRRGHAIERGARLGQAARVEIQHAKL